jgi:Pyruvate/2-oxoacid:ferredoxin oxidoreductase delta subunit
LCGTVCPSGAIKQFARDEKKNLVIGIAHVNLENCLLTTFKECDLCKKYCEYNAVEIQSNRFPAFPIIVEDRCVGCGACVVVCPERVIHVEINSNSH